MAEQNSIQQNGSLERGLSGDFNIAIADVIHEAWSKVYGNKATLWIAIALYMAVLFVIAFVFGLFEGPTATPGAGASSPADLFQQVLTTLIAGPLGAGLIFLGVAIASGTPANPLSIFSWYAKTLPLFLTYLLMVLMIMLGTMLLVIPGIYLSIAYQLALPLVVDRDMGPWEALETSRKVMTHHWFTFFGLWFIAALAMLLSSLLLGVPLIWVLPAIIIGIGIVYRDSIGALQSSLEQVVGDS